ncbi:unnamed protein product [Dovyalis caffra]|uniref:GIY-YIG homing endonuclease n=1 Tax=Dovyalis caffra TaxID=77055 RepID=A0AAV1RSN1_9ROSI|nr:unnamed protein product [Dovyalis caffra]
MASEEMNLLDQSRVKFYVYISSRLSILIYYHMPSYGVIFFNDMPVCAMNETTISTFKRHYNTLNRPIYAKKATTISIVNAKRHQLLTKQLSNHFAFKYNTAN